MTDFRSSVVSAARGYLGQHEDAAHTNHGPFVARCLAYVGLAEGYAWCSAFACLCVGEAAQHCGLSFTNSRLIKTASVQQQVDHARTLGTALDASLVLSGKVTVCPGDLMCEYEDSLNRYAHTGIVETSPSPATPLFTTIEGNSNTDGSREGYEVVRQHRKVSDLTPGGHNKYCFISLL